MGRPVFVDIRVYCARRNYGDLTHGETFKVKEDDPLTEIHQKTDYVRGGLTQSILLRTGETRLFFNDKVVYTYDIGCTYAAAATAAVSTAGVDPEFVSLRDELSIVNGERHVLQVCNDELKAKLSKADDTMKTAIAKRATEDKLRYDALERQFSEYRTGAMRDYNAGAEKRRKLEQQVEALKSHSDTVIKLTNELEALKAEQIDVVTSTNNALLAVEIVELRAKLAAADHEIEAATARYEGAMKFGKYWQARKEEADTTSRSYLDAMYAVRKKEDELLKQWETFRESMNKRLDELTVENNALREAAASTAMGYGEALDDIKLQKAMKDYQQDRLAELETKLKEANERIDYHRKLAKRWKQQGIKNTAAMEALKNAYELRSKKLINAMIYETAQGYRVHGAVDRPRKTRNDAELDLYAFVGLDPIFD